MLRIREKGLPDFTFQHKKIYIYSYQRKGESSVNKFIQQVLRYLQAYIDKKDKIIEVIEKVDILKDTIPILKQLPPVIQQNNLLERYPHLEKEWHYEKNYPFRPEHFKAKSNYQVWWICENGHEHDTKIISRTKGHGCRFCAGLEVTEENSLATIYPNLAMEWDWDENGDLSPETIHAYSNRIAFWICPDCESSYDKKVNERSGGGENCPYCAGKRVNQTNSLEALRPDLADEWHPTVNTKKTSEVSLGSHYEATWICKRGHEFKTKVYERTGKKKRGCKTCYEEIGRFQPHKVPFEKSIAKKKPFLLNQWDYEKNEVSPEEVGAYARQMVWWKCSNGCSWDQEPNARNSSRCKKCRVKD